MSDEKESDFVDFYALLDVSVSASASEIRKAYLLKAKEDHPDAGGEHDAMQLLNKAYQTLKNSTSRRAYDMQHQFHTGTTAILYKTGDSAEEANTDIPDELIDSFVDSIFEEYSVSKPKQTMHQKLKRKFKR